MAGGAQAPVWWLLDPCVPLLPCAPCLGPKQDQGAASPQERGGFQPSLCLTLSEPQSSLL